ncbi:phage virion morphogenesis protein [Ralstonia sp. CHL-2022]|uniref:Phage virion morphogenesis protein n=1 Tax=Ralstonia mojiangensis TaxID=2953895 RepID=A0AAE3LCQ3_9RALS|nr:phage virion morphogenesis protein [Ralstonia mojiangensis]MCT7316742.1 phage virion morphogenesis protein [Ralstonia mojiangensis]
MSNLHELDAYLVGLLGKLEAPQRRALARAIAVELRRRQSARIAAQRNPDGTAYEPRKPQLRHTRGGIRRSMFTRLRMAKYMRVEASPQAAVISFAGKVRHIASVHHFGLRDRVNKNGLMAQYPARELLGLDEQDVQHITNLVLLHVSKP